MMKTHIDKMSCTSCNEVPTVPAPCFSKKHTTIEEKDLKNLILCKKMTKGKYCEYDCEKCGLTVKFKKFQDGMFGPMKAECTHCGTRNDGTELFCVNCGVVFL